MQEDRGVALAQDYSRPPKNFPSPLLGDAAGAEDSGGADWGAALGHAAPCPSLEAMAVAGCCHCSLQEQPLGQAKEGSRNGGTHPCSLSRYGWSKASSTSEEVAGTTLATLSS